MTYCNSSQYLLYRQDSGVCFHFRLPLPSPQWVDGSSTFGEEVHCTLLCSEDEQQSRVAGKGFLIPLQNWALIPHLSSGLTLQFKLLKLLKFQELYACFLHLTLKIVKKWLETTHPYPLTMITRLDQEVKKNLVPPKLSHREEAWQCHLL